ncbi:MAG TPA: hypothetical protein DEW46_14080 [Verrucomicrobia bacterium]|jgi:signal transduction histidine kinase|nr:hypothetical protein [Verrucomicrobiota bacterium]
MVIQRPPPHQLTMVLAFGSGLFTAILGVSAAVGWVAHIPSLIQVLPGNAPMQFNTAICFLLCGAALVCLGLDQDTPARITSAIAAGTALVTLLQYLFSIDFGIDQLFLVHYLTERSSHPGRMAPSSACCFLLAYITVEACIRSGRSPRLAFLSGTAASLIVMIGAIAFLGISVELHKEYYLGNMTQVAIHSSIGFILWGIGALACCWKRTTTHYPTVYWLPVSVGLGVATLNIGAWIAQEAENHTNLHSQTASAVSAAVDELRVRLNNLLDGIDRMALRWSIRNGTPIEEWRQDAAAHVAQISGLRNLGWIDHTLTVQYIEPIQGFEGVPGLDLNRYPSLVETIRFAEEHRVPALSPITETKSGKAILHILVPIFQQQGAGGFLFGEIGLEEFLAPTLGKSSNSLMFCLRSGQTTVFQSHGWEAAEGSIVETASATFPGHGAWTLSATPRNRVIQQGRAQKMVGVTGLLLALSTALTTLFAQKARANAQKLRHHQEHLEETVRRRTVELERSNRELEQFAYVASHDLQEPLRMVSSFTQLLSQRYSDKLDDEAHSWIDFAVEGAERMHGLINDLLEYSRVTTRGGGFEIIDSRVALDHALANLQISLNETGGIVTHGELPHLYANPVQLVQLFQNLIGNAIKFRGRHTPRIHVAAQPRQDHWVFSVTDNGIGIPERHKEKIFVIFQRLHSRREYKGTGIGLALCKRIVERHGGTIWLESEEGKGSTFFFTIPKHPQDSPLPTEEVTA